MTQSGDDKKTNTKMAGHVNLILTLALWLTMVQCLGVLADSKTEFEKAVQQQFPNRNCTDQDRGQPGWKCKLQRRRNCVPRNKVCEGSDTLSLCDDNSDETDGCNLFPSELLVKV